MKKIIIVFILCICLCGCKDEKRLVCVLEEKSELSQDETTFDLYYQKKELVKLILTVQKNSDDTEEITEWTEMEQTNITNSKSLGITGSTSVADNIGIVTYIYDVQNNPNLKEMVAEDTEYNALKENLISEGYTCGEK